MTLTVACRNSTLPERSYILACVLRDFLGLEFQLIEVDREGLTITCPAIDPTSSLILSDVLLAKLAVQGITTDAMPSKPLARWSIEDPALQNVVIDANLPVIYGEKLSNGSCYVQSGSTIELGLDIFGSAFFMLSRMEEFLCPESDKMNRFPIKSAIAFQEGFFDRPIINEYIEILWSCLKRLWPKLERKPRQFTIYPSHDIDTPFEQFGSTFSRLIRASAVDLLVLKEPLLAMKRVVNWLQVNNGSYQKDFAYIYEYLMDIEDQHNVKSSFFFITGVVHPKFTNRFPIEQKQMREVLRRIHRRNHYIGVHGGHYTYNDVGKLQEEFSRIRNTCKEEGINQAEWGGRQHNLQWKAPLTWRVWNDAGLDYDSSLAFSEQAGFRCGICYNFATYDIEKREPMKLREYPLIAMEVSLLRKDYMNLSFTDTIREIHRLMEICRKFNGDFTVLWHNTNNVIFSRKNLLKLYRQVYEG